MPEKGRRTEALPGKTALGRAGVGATGKRKRGREKWGQRNQDNHMSNRFLIFFIPKKSSNLLPENAVLGK